MKITPRLLVVLACAWCGLPLLRIAFHPVAFLGAWTHAPVSMAFDVTRALLLAIGWGAYMRRSWIARLSLGLAIGWSLLAGVFVLATPMGWYGVGILFDFGHSLAPAGRGDAVAAGIAGLVGDALGLVAWTWAIALVSQRSKPAQATSEMVSRSFSSRDASENRLVHLGLGGILAWLLVWPLLINPVSPLRQLGPGTWTTDAEHARIVLTDAQRQVLSPESLRVVDDINDDLAHIAAGQPPLHSTAKPGTHF
jgi:hypothetical protein